MTDIVTLRLDPASQENFESMRQRYFPPERNLVPAHLTLFHALPATQEISTALMSMASSTPAFPLPVIGLRSLGRGVAYTLEAPQLRRLHRLLSLSLAAYLTPQDQQKFRPHIVVQNKSTDEQARELLAVLQAGFQSFTVQAEGIDLWHYLGGPWELSHQFDFSC